MSNPVLEQAKQHWLKKIGEVRVVEVPEWGTDDEPLKIYVRPASLAVRDQIYQHAKDGSLKALAATLVARSRYEDGRQMFRGPELPELMREVDPDVLARVVEEMNKDLELTTEEAAGN